MGYEIIKSEKDFLMLEEKWVFLFEELEEKNIFKSFSWNYSWWNEIKQTNSLFIVTFFSNIPEKLCAIFPFAIDAKGVLRFIADTHSDYSDILISSGLDRSELYEISKTFNQIIENSNEILAIELKNLTSSYGYLSIILSSFNDKKVFYNSNASSNMIIQGNDFSSCFSHLKAKKRNKLKRLLKKHSTFSTRLYFSNNHTFPESTIKDIVQEMKDNGTRDQNFLNSTLLKIIRTLYENNHLIIHEVYDNDKTLVMNFILHHQSSQNYLIWISVYRNIPKIHIASYLLFIEKMCKNSKDFIILDFGRGLYDYKIHNFLPEIYLQFTFFYAKNNIVFFKYIFKRMIFDLIKPFYKKHKKIINKALRR